MTELLTKEIILRTINLQIQPTLTAIRLVDTRGELVEHIQTPITNLGLIYIRPYFRPHATRAFALNSQIYINTRDNDSITMELEYSEISLDCAQIIERHLIELIGKRDEFAAIVKQYHPNMYEELA